MTDQAAVRAYLLGELGDDRVAALEQALLGDRELLELVEGVERDLVDDYAAGRLSGADREGFERHCLTTPRQRARLFVARALLDHGRRSAGAATPRDSTAAPHGGDGLARLARTLGVVPRAVGWATAAALALAVGTLVVALWPVEPSERASVSGPSPAIGPDAPRPAPESPPPAAPEPVRVALVLPAVATRGSDGTPRVNKTAEVTVVDLMLQGSRVELADNAAVEIRSVDDRVVWTGITTSPPSPEKGVVAAVSVPADRLPADDYILTATDRTGEILGRYFFRVTPDRR